MQWVTTCLARDTSRKPAQYVGAPSPQKDWRGLYKKNDIVETLKLIERESLRLKPHRIIVLYVPSNDVENLLRTLDIVCFLSPLKPDGEDLPNGDCGIGWRHNKSIARNIVDRTIRGALRNTDALKSEITDRRISPLTLPARNFYFPNSHTTISSTYQMLALNAHNFQCLKDRLPPLRFKRDQLPSQAFKGQQHTDQFFQDRRGRVFPPDLFHARNRPHSTDISTSKPSTALRQRYRFGVTVRNGNLHYDVQFERQRKLIKEPMHCAVEGNVLVTGSHANVGVNDVIWVPSGKKESPVKKAQTNVAPKRLS